MELARSHGAAAEQRETLVTTALHALQQLRGHLGAVHAIRPEAARPLDEALHVKPALGAGCGLSDAASSPQPPGSGGLGGALPPREGLMRPSSGMMEQFLQRIANESALLVSGTLPAEWTQASSRPKPERLMTSPAAAAGQHDAGYHPHAAVPSSPHSSMRRPWTTTRPLTPLDVAFERSRAGNMLRVPQPGTKQPMMMSSASHPELPSASLLSSYATIKSHLDAARTLTNF